MWRTNPGLRIYRLLLSLGVVDCWETCAVGREPRAAKAPSDHAPVWCLLSDDTDSSPAG